MTLNEMAKAAGENAIAHGFRDANATTEERVALIPQRIALIHSEASELLEHARNGENPAELWFNDRRYATARTSFATDAESGKLNKPDGVPAELADIIIRCGDFANEHGINLESAVRLKMAYNATRPYKHGKKL